MAAVAATAGGGAASNGVSAAAPLWSMEVAERRAGAPTSDPAVLTLAALPDAHIVAIGSGGGIVALYILQVRHVVVADAF